MKNKGSRKKREYKVGDHVQYISGGEWKPCGIIIEKSHPLKHNGGILVSSMYRVQWDEGGDSGWLSWYDLMPL